MDAIQVDRLSKSYDGTRFALKELELTIPEGEIFGFLGPNGSGKTTTVRLLNGVLSPSAGKASILGHDVQTNQSVIHSLCGIMTETAAPYENLTGWENLQFFGKLYGIEPKEIAKRSENLLKVLDLTEEKNKKVKNYSSGMKKRISLARALIHNPKILFLDEPTSGLDPEASINVSRMIQQLSREQGVTVFLCTHQLKYAQDICTLYGFIDEGTLLGFGSFNELLRKKNNKTYLEIRGESLPALKGLEKMGDVYRIQIDSDQEASSILYESMQSGGKVYEARQIHWNLEDLYFCYQKGASGNE